MGCMSAAQLEATALLCSLLERSPMEITAAALLAEHRQAALPLFQERLLVPGPRLEWVSCPECGVESARVRRDVSVQHVALTCPRCEVIQAPVHVCQTYQLALQRLIPMLLSGLNLSLAGMRPLEPDRCWRLGTLQPARGKVLTWYFARELDQLDVAARLREQIMRERTSTSCRVLTSTELPLPHGSPMEPFDVCMLSSVGRISQNRFEFFSQRMVDASPAHAESNPSPGTTLRHVRHHGKVLIDGEEYLLEPRQKALLLALMDDLDHEMSLEGLRSACGSQAQRFSPSKAFDRSEDARLIYRTFVKYLVADERYTLLVPEEDHAWLPAAH